ncbi:MAG TPA: hypothetical protein VGO03_05495 [Acidimicrobiia bacterium]
MHSTLRGIGIDRVPPSIAVERDSGPIEFTAALPVAGDVRHHGAATTYELPVSPGPRPQ